jgi:protein tyrosine phosphatase (PTP) superfamily phosphohydrolase (DUF442 family)/cytochrome c556
LFIKTEIRIRMSHRIATATGLLFVALVVVDVLNIRSIADDVDGETVPRTAGPTSKEHPALHNLIAVTKRIYSGSEPDDDAAFESLQKLGVKTIVSVDGATPDVASARGRGMRYIHIPIGYDGVPAEAGAALARVVREIDGPIYVHCHHGRHRGPAAAAIACIAAGAADGRQALNVLTKAGTGKEYPGLWRDVAAYKPPAADAKLPELHEVARVGSLAAAMAKIDRTFDELKLCQQADWMAPVEHPDLAPRAEVALVREQFREAARLLTKDHDARFKTWLAEAEATAGAIESALQSDEPDKATRSLQQLETSCKRCHAAYRN